MWGEFLKFSRHSGIFVYFSIAQTIHVEAVVFGMVFHFTSSAFLHNLILGVYVLYIFPIVGFLDVLKDVN